MWTKKKKKVVCSLSCAGLKSAKGNLDCLKSHSLTPQQGGEKNNSACIFLWKHNIKVSAFSSYFGGARKGIRHKLCQMKNTLSELSQTQQTKQQHTWSIESCNLNSYSDTVFLFWWERRLHIQLHVNRTVAGCTCSGAGRVRSQPLNTKDIITHTS